MGMGGDGELEEGREGELRLVCKIFKNLNKKDIRASVIYMEVIYALEIRISNEVLGDNLGKIITSVLSEKLGFHIHRPHRENLT